MSNPNTPSPHRLRIGGLLRVLLLMSVIFVASIAWLAHRAHAELSERSLMVGRELSRANRIAAGTTVVTINGQTLSLNSSSSDRTVGEVLERFETLCGAENGGMGEQLSALIRSGVEVPSALRPDRLGVFESRPNEREGIAGCFASRDDGGGLGGMLARIKRVVSTGDLSELGQFRYVFARTSEGGQGSHVISVWADGALRVRDMFPATGDVPGADIVEGVRPPRAQRVLAGEGEGTGYQVALYESESTPAEVLASYDTQLAQRGYAPLGKTDMAELVPVATHVYFRDGRDGLMVLATENDGKTVVSALRVGMDRFVELRQ